MTGTALENRRVIIIGGGLSGLAAGIRLSQYGMGVQLFEQHSVLGGLNSYYNRNGRCYDTGLHAMTNVGPTTDRALPLNVLFRQLRIRRDDVQLCPQTRSEIRFPGACLAFDNDFSTLASSVASCFPRDIDNFQSLVQRIRQWNPFVTTGDFMPTRAVLRDSVDSELLRQMLLMPVMFYGNSVCHDMDFRQYCILFRSMFLEGMGRPRLGMKHFIGLLNERLVENGGRISLNNGISSIQAEHGHVCGVMDKQGIHYQADHYLSCAGAPETAALIQDLPQKLPWHTVPGQMGYAEFIFELSCLPRKLNLDKSVTFLHENGEFDYAPTEEIIDLDNMVICVPGNFADVESCEARVTAVASVEKWQKMPDDEYRAAKTRAVKMVMQRLEKLYAGFDCCVQNWQMYTPRTFTRFTKRINGSIYGSPDKAWDGRTPYDNLHLIGTDQGYLGIVGAMMSGVTAANGILRGT